VSSVFLIQSDIGTDKILSPILLYGFPGFEPTIQILPQRAPSYHAVGVFTASGGFRSPLCSVCFHYTEYSGADKILACLLPKGFTAEDAEGAEWNSSQRIFPRIARIAWAASVVVEVADA
jgi:hypothetical protein